MRFGNATIVADLDAVETEPEMIRVYDRDIGVRLLYEDPATGEEHYLIRYMAGLRATAHRHTAAHTIIVLRGRLTVNDDVVGPGSYCHFPAGGHDVPCARRRRARRVPESLLDRPTSNRSRNGSRGGP